MSNPERLLCQIKRNLSGFFIDISYKSHIFFDALFLKKLSGSNLNLFRKKTNLDSEEIQITSECIFTSILY